MFREPRLKRGPRIEPLQGIFWFSIAKQQSVFFPRQSFPNLKRVGQGKSHLRAEGGEKTPSREDIIEQGVFLAVYASRTRLRWGRSLTPFMRIRGFDVPQLTVASQ